MMSGPPNLRQRMLPGRHSVSASWWISSSTGVRIPGTLQRAVCEWTRSTVRSAVAEMAQVDHRVGQGLEGIVDVADELVANQHTTKLILPSKHAFDGAKALFEDGRAEHALGSALGGLPDTRVLVDVGNHATVEDCLSVHLAIVGTVQADDAPSEIDANGLGDARQFRQRLWQQRGLIAVARRRNKRCDHVAVAVAERHDLVASEVLVPVEANVVATLLGDGCRAVTVQGTCIEVAALVQCEHGAREYCADTASRLPVTKHPVDARVVNFGKTLCILFDRQLLPLTPRVKHSQDVIENPMQWQFW